MTLVASNSCNMKNAYGGMHGGAVGSVAERVAISCARTVVADNIDLFLGELGISYLSAAPHNGKILVFVTNNSTKSRKQYGKKFETLGLNVSEEEIFASSFAAAAYLSSIDFPELHCICYSKTWCSRKNIRRLINELSKHLRSVLMSLGGDSVNMSFNVDKGWKVPKQPNGFQCGYYVMKYLSEIIKSDGLETITSLQSLFNKNSYSTEEIDQVRTKWADCMQDYMYA